ncbi:MAG: multiheme c-type cytochrome [Pirellulaceae bacterium]
MTTLQLRTDQRTLTRPGARLVCWILAALTASACAPAEFLARAEAVPHTVAHVDHPFDPDWPDVHRILADKCSGCHRPQSDQSSFMSYEALLEAGHDDEMPAVVPGQPEESWLYLQVRWNADAKRNSDLPDTPDMPPDRHEWLTAAQQELIRRWIAGGAHRYRLPDTCRERPLMEMDFPSAKQCSACHPKQYEEWSRSMHAYAQHSPVFEAFNLTLIERTSGTIGTFCTRCHTNIGTALGENGSRRNVHRSRIAMEGVTCVTCHRRKDGRYKASGRVAIAPGELLDGCIYGPFDGAVSEEVGSHKSSHLPYLRSSQFCGECHDVFAPTGVRLEEAFSEWQNSPAAADRVTCQQCHMGPVQGVPIAECERPLGRAAVVPGVDPEKIPLRHLSDHTFAGPDYSLLPDTEFPYKLDWMYEKDYRNPACLTPHEQRTLIELRLKNREQLKKYDAKRYELLRNSARIKVHHADLAHAGGLLPVTVDVTSTTAGHSLPTGFTAERQVWISIEVRDPRGKVVFASGDFDDNGDLRDDHSHAVLAGKVHYDKHLLNFQNKFIALTNKGTERSVVVSVNRHLQPLNIFRPVNTPAQSFGRPGGFRIAKGSLPPLRTMGQRYPVRLGSCSGPHTVHVRLNFRHLPPTLLDHIGTPHLKHLLETVVIDEYHGVVDVSPF